MCFRAALIKLPSISYAPEIGTADMKHFYKMPLSQREFEEIFGKPERVEDSVKL
jgi:hypothetical protein